MEALLLFAFTQIMWRLQHASLWVQASGVRNIIAGNRLQTTFPETQGCWCRADLGLAPSNEVSFSEIQIAPSSAIIT